VKPAPPKQAPAKQGASPQPKPAVAKPQTHTPGPAVKNDGKRYLRSLDDNHDGRITQKEFLGRTQERFDALDLNHDGVISPEEASQAKTAQLKKKAEREARKKLLARAKNKKNTPLALPQAGAEATAKPARPAKPPLARLDANGDGRVTRQEYLAKRQEKFAEMDLNHDGVISREEAKIAKAKVLARRAELRAEQKERAAHLAEQAAARAEKAALKDARKQRSAEIVAEKEARAGRKRDKLARKAQAEWGLNMDPPEELQQDQPAPR
jgi:Ca2+-binding EF-hand superfamily protein